MGTLSRVDRAALAEVVLASSRLPIFLLDADGTIHDANPAAAGLLGMDAEDLAGRPFAELVLEQQRGQVADHLDAVAGGTAAEHLEVDLVRLDQTRVPFGVSFSSLQVDEDTEGFVGIGRDISDRRQIVHEMRETARGFLALAEGTDLGIYRFSFHPEMRVDYVNPAFTEVAGCSLAELQERPELLARGLPPETVALLDRSRRRNVTIAWPVETRWRRPDGTEIIISVRETQVRDVHGRLEAVLGVVRDVTADRQHAQMLATAARQEREAASRLRRVDELRRLFLQAVSHELRTPLTALMGVTDTLQRLDLPDERIARLLERQRIAGQRLKTLLDDLLDVERLSRGVITVEREPLDLGELVMSYVAGQVDGEVEVDVEPAQVLGDRTKLERVLDNLLQNACRHAGPDARIEVRVRRVGTSVHLEVEDDGPGVSADEREVIFEAFVQGEAAEHRAQPGTGIGLTLVAELTRLHDGRCWVEQGELGGARFVVGLPAAEDAAG